jgi:hypothetical protein
VPLTRGEVEGVKGLRCSVGAFKQSWLGGHHPDHSVFPADVDVGAVIGPRSPQQWGQASEALMASPSLLKGKIRLPKTDRHSGRSIVVTACHREFG